MATNEKLKILIVSHSFPPMNKIGSLRPYSWAKYWSREGHEICVLTTKKYGFDGFLDLYVDTPEMKNLRIEEVDYLPFRKFNNKKKRVEVKDKYNYATNPFSAVSKVKQTIMKIRKHTGPIPHMTDLWSLPAINKALEIHKQWPFDIIVSSFKPQASHVIAGILKRKLNIFWVADYRDLWHGNHFFPVKCPFSFVERKIEEFFVKNSDLITTVSEPLKDKLVSRFGNKVITIENGFDVEELDKIGGKNIFLQNGKVRLVYTGTIYPEKRDPSPLFEAINFLKKRGLPIEKRLEIIFYGLNFGNLQDLIKKYNLYEIVKTPGFVDRETVLQIQKSANALIFLEWEDPSVDGILTGKLFEYMYSNRPILGIGVSSLTTAGRLIEEAGVGLALGKSVEKIADILEKMLNGCMLSYAPSSAVLKRYTREGLAKKMLNEIIKLRQELRK